MNFTVKLLCGLHDDFVGNRWLVQSSGERFCLVESDDDVFGAPLSTSRFLLCSFGVEFYLTWIILKLKHLPDNSRMQYDRSQRSTTWRLTTWSLTTWRLTTWSLTTWRFTTWRLTTWSLTTLRFTTWRYWKVNKNN